MVISNASSAALLSNIYSTNADALTQSLSKIASGKRVQNPGDDFAAYVRAAGLNNDIVANQGTIQDLQNAKGAVDYATGVGNNILEDLQRLSDLQSLWSAANTAGDTDKTSAYSAEYDAIVNRITNTATNSTYDGEDVYDADSIISAGTINVQATNAADAGSLSAGGISGDNVAGEITKAQAYVADLSSFGTAISREMKLLDVMNADKKATVAALINVDELTEMANVTNLQVRQQAAVSMMSQANMSQAALAGLFG